MIEERAHLLLDLEHYLDVLERKPGALAGANWREQGLWPESHGRLWQDLTRRHGCGASTEQTSLPVRWLIRRSLP